jgi:hypothetical protein
VVRRLTAVILCGLVGTLGGTLTLVVGQASVVTGVLLGGLYGVLFALFVAPRAVSPGAGLVWGLGYAFILWLAMSAGILPVIRGGMPALGMLDTACAHFPALVAYVLGFGMPLGGRWASGAAFSPRQGMSV